MKYIYFALLGAFVIFGSCSTGEAAAGSAALSGGSSQALLFLDCKAASEDVIEFSFSKAVKVTSINFEPDLSIASVEDGSVVRVRLKERQEPGLKFTADLLAEDEQRNTINVLVSIRSRNNRMPQLVINEICTDWSNPKTEFIEFKTLSAGNLGAMRVFILGNTKATQQTIYEFLPAEVKKDEYITLHLRKVEPDCVDEYGENLSASGGKNSSPTARDIWFPGNVKLMHKEATAIYVMDQDDRVLAAVMLSNSQDGWWTKDYLAEAAEFLYSQGAWKSTDGNICRPADAVRSTGTTNTRTICRDETVENTNTAADWYITATSSATPGGPNNPKRYVP
ncbi:MAG: hypothetical protein LBH44_03750 [Treponema sp.]|jgi:hypothetical protein|nr:hypothetical protein [Treponema sp.]